MLPINRVDVRTSLGINTYKNDILGRTGIIPIRSFFVIYPIIRESRYLIRPKQTIIINRENTHLGDLYAIYISANKEVYAKIGDYSTTQSRINLTSKYPPLDNECSNLEITNVSNDNARVKIVLIGKLCL